jgi:hypothetical protein
MNKIKKEKKTSFKKSYSDTFINPLKLPFSLIRQLEDKRLAELISGIPTLFGYATFQPQYKCIRIWYAE